MSYDAEPIIRRLTIADYDDIVRVWKNADLSFMPEGRERQDILQKEFEQSHCAAFGLFIDSRMIGTVLANWDGRRGWISRLAVEPEYRGRGHAGMLIRACEVFFEEKGALLTAAFIKAGNTKSMAAFGREGYVCLPKMKLFRKILREGT